MKLGAEIGLRVFKIFYWALWVGEFGAVVLIAFVLDNEQSHNYFEVVMMVIVTALVVVVTHYVLTIPIGKKLAEIKAND
jgi:ABC-type sulfate transport system permease component